MNTCILNTPLFILNMKYKSYNSDTKEMYKRNERQKIVSFYRWPNLDCDIPVFFMNGFGIAFVKRLDSFSSVTSLLVWNTVPLVIIFRKLYGQFKIEKYCFWFLKSLWFSTLMYHLISFAEKLTKLIIICIKISSFGQSRYVYQDFIKLA